MLVCIAFLIFTVISIWWCNISTVIYFRLCSIPMAIEVRWSSFSSVYGNSCIWPHYLSNIINSSDTINTFFKFVNTITEIFFIITGD